MSFEERMDNRVKRLDWIDLGFVKAGAMLFALCAAKLWPSLLSLDAWVYGLLFVLCAARPLTRFFRTAGNGRDKI